MRHWLILVCALTGDQTHNLDWDDALTNWAPARASGCTSLCGVSTPVLTVCASPPQACPPWEWAPWRQGQLSCVPVSVGPARCLPRRALLEGLLEMDTGRRQEFCSLCLLDPAHQQDPDILSAGTLSSWGLSWPQVMAGPARAELPCAAPSLPTVKRMWVWTSVKTRKRVTKQNPRKAWGTNAIKV